jgi:hypothetical protein
VGDAAGAARGEFARSATLLEPIVAQPSGKPQGLRRGLKLTLRPSKPEPCRAASRMRAEPVCRSSARPTLPYCGRFKTVPNQAPLGRASVATAHPPSRSTICKVYIERIRVAVLRDVVLQVRRARGVAMLERLLETGSTELPPCACGKEMRYERTQLATSDTEIRIFRCPDCERELRLTVWSAAVLKG